MYTQIAFFSFIIVSQLFKIINIPVVLSLINKQYACIIEAIPIVSRLTAVKKYGGLIRCSYMTMLNYHILDSPRLFTIYVLSVGWCILMHALQKITELLSQIHLHLYPYDNCKLSGRRSVLK